MKLTKPTVWIAGIVVAAVVVAFVLLSRGKDSLTVHLVDANKKPVSASVTVHETRLYPILGSMKFLPDWARASTKTNEVNAIDGILKVRRVKTLGKYTILTIRAQMKPSEFEVIIIGQTNGAGVYRSQEKVGEIEPKQTEISVILD